MPGLILIALLILFLAGVGYGMGVRESVLAALTAATVALVLLTEVLSLFSAVTFWWLSAGWLLVTLGAAFGLHTRVGSGVATLRARRVDHWTTFDWIVSAVLAFFVLGTLASALLYPVVNWDSLTYHMPRVFFWIQNRSVAFYPTAEARQLFSSTLVEYVALHLKVLAGGSDRFVNLAQWLAYAVSIAAVSLIARRLGAERRGQQVAALAAAATPMAVLQASTTQSDLTCALWCLVTVCCALGYIAETPVTASRRWMWALWTGAALGLAVASKSTAYLFCLPFLVWLAVAAIRREGWRRAGGLAALVIVVALGVGAATYARNARVLDGDALAVSAPSNVQTIIKNRVPQVVATTALKNLSMMVGTPSAAVNDRIASGFRSVIRSYGGDPEDPRAKAADWGDYAIPSQSFSHDVAPAPLSVLLLLVSAVVLLALRDQAAAHAAPYLLCAGLALLIAVGLLTWQPWINRLLLGPVLLLCPIVGVAASVSARRGSRLAFATILSLVGVAVAWGALVMTFNETNRLVPMSVIPGRSFVKDVGYWNTPREDLAFRLTAQPLERPFKAVAQTVKESGIRRIGIDDRAGDVRIYPLLSLLPDTRFDYVRDTVLPERISAGEPEPQAIVEIVPAEAFPEVLSDGKRRGRQLIQPQASGDVVIMLYANP